MASFVGTNQEFRRYIGPRLRNLVQQITKNHKAEVSICEHCGTKKDLESAHVQGRDRNQIIDLVLNEYTHNDIVTVDINVFEEQFKQEHHPINKSILILCRSCHRKYDSKVVQELQIKHEESKPQVQAQTFKVNGNGVLPITLEPTDPNIFKNDLLVFKKAEIQTTYSDGRIEQKPWIVTKLKASSNVIGNLRSRPEYRSGNWQSKGIIKVHVKVLKNA